MALGQVTHHFPPKWKRQELGDLRAAMLDISAAAAVDETAAQLHRTALNHYQEGWPAPLVAWAANRAWAQGTPGDFLPILRNHAQETVELLRELGYGG